MAGRRMGGLEWRVERPSAQKSQQVTGTMKGNQGVISGDPCSRGIIPGQGEDFVWGLDLAERWEGVKCASCGLQCRRVLLQRAYQTGKGTKTVNETAESFCSAQRVLLQCVYKTVKETICAFGAYKTVK